MFRALLISAPILILPLAAPAPLAPLAGLEAAAAVQGGQDCQRQNEGRRQGGRVLGAIGRNLLGRVGGGGVASIVLPMASVLGDELMRLLDCDEQEKAATATEQVVDQAERGGVGTTVAWESESRPGVRGSSTVTAVETASAEGDCMTVTDVVIIDGEETRAPKRMCRRPPSNRYVRV